MAIQRSERGKSDQKHNKTVMKRDETTTWQKLH